MKIKHFIFDIGGVLINFSIPGLLEKISGENMETLERLHEVCASEAVYRVETGKISGKQFFKDYIKKEVPALDYEGWIREWMDNYSIRNDGMDIVKDLKKKNKKQPPLFYLPVHFIIIIFHLTVIFQYLFNLPHKSIINLHLYSYLLKCIKFIKPSDRLQ